MLPVSDSARPRLASKARLKWDEARQKHLLLFPEGVLVLNPTAHEVVALCDGQRTVADLVQVLHERYKREGDGSDIKELLGRLVEKSLLVMAE